MRKLAFVLVTLGSALAAFGFSGWQLTTSGLWQEAGRDWFISAGWSVGDRLAIVVGVAMLVCGLLMRKGSN
jgi:hypothetical protein